MSSRGQTFVISEGRARFPFPASCSWVLSQDKNCQRVILKPRMETKSGLCWVCTSGHRGPVTSTPPPGRGHRTGLGVAKSHACCTSTKSQSTPP